MANQFRLLPMTKQEQIDLLVRVRNRLGWSRDQLGGHVGRTGATIYLWETGHAPINREMLHWLVTVDFLLNESEKKKVEPSGTTSSVAETLIVGGLVGLIIGLFLGDKK